MFNGPNLDLIPDSDWPHIRALVARKMEISEDEVQKISDGGDSLAKVELAMAVEEVLEDIEQ
jgi:hypothetical protein